MYRLSLCLLLIMLAAGLGCKRRQQSEDTETTTPTPNPPSNIKQQPTQLTAQQATEKLRARGAEVETSDGKPDSPVARVHMRGPSFGNEDLALLRPYTYLRYLDLSDSKVTDAGLQTISTMDSLFMIDLSRTAVTDAGAILLAKCKFLSAIHLEGTSVTDKTLEQLAKLTAPRVIDVRRTQVTAAGIAKYRQVWSNTQFVEDTTFADYQSPDGLFSASFPWYQPKPRVRNERTPFGVIVDTAYEVDWKGWSAVLFVADLNAPNQPKVDPEKLVLTGRDEIARSLKAKVAKEEKSKSEEGYSVWEFTYRISERPGQGPIYQRSVIAGNRIFTMMVLVNIGTVPPAERDRFFNSLKILK